MNERQKFDLYEEHDRKIAGVAAGESKSMDQLAALVYIDLTLPFHQMISPIRDLLKDKPDGFAFDVAFFSGKEINSDSKLFVDYMKSVVEPSYEVKYYYRGIIHPEVIGLFFGEIYVAKSSQLLYKKSTLHDFMLGLMESPAVFRLFVQRFIDVYSQYPNEILLDIAELTTIGLNIKTY